MCGLTLVQHNRSVVILRSFRSTGPGKYYGRFAIWPGFVIRALRKPFIGRYDRSVIGRKIGTPESPGTRTALDGLK